MIEKGTEIEAKPDPHTKDVFSIRIQVQSIGPDRGRYATMVVAIASQLAWLAAAFGKPSETSLSFCRAVIEPVDSRGSLSESAYRIGTWPSTPELSLQDPHWCHLFTGLNIAAGFPIPGRPRDMHGVQLSFDVMATLAGVTGPVRYNHGYVLKGRKYALFPVSSPDLPTKARWRQASIQWRVFRTNRPRLYMEEIEEAEPSLEPLRTDLSPETFIEELKKSTHFLGLDRSSKIRVDWVGAGRWIKSLLSLSSGH